MRKLIRFACAALLLAGCQKEEATPTPTYSPGKPGLGSPKYGVLTYDAVSGSCGGSPCDCPDIPPIIVEGVIAAFDNVFTAIGTGVPATIQAAFHDNKSELIRVMVESDVDAIVGGTLQASAAGTDPNKTRFVLVYPLGGGTLKIAYRIDCVR